MTNFLKWIDLELAKRGWKYSELARRADISRNAVSAVMTGKNNVSWEFCYNIAQAFELSPVEVFKKAGLLSTEKVDDSEIVEDLSVQFMSQLADMLGMTTLELFRQLGLFPHVQTISQSSTDELYNLINQLSPEKKVEVINYVKSQIQNQN